MSSQFLIYNNTWKAVECHQWKISLAFMFFRTFYYDQSNMIKIDDEANAEKESVSVEYSLSCSFSTRYWNLMMTILCNSIYHSLWQNKKRWKFMKEIISRIMRTPTGPILAVPGFESIELVVPAVLLRQLGFKVTIAGVETPNTTVKSCRLVKMWPMYS
jgi:hypothetical protein